MILCVCPTYGRPRLLANSLACFLAQDHPDKYLIILDDAGQYDNQEGDKWRLISLRDRLPCLPAKYLEMFSHMGVLPFRSTGSRFNQIAIWDDDDIYLPNHLSSHATILLEHPWSYPESVYKLDDPKGVKIEHPDGNMWASIAFRANLLRAVGFPDTREASFDLQFIGRLRGGGVHGNTRALNPGRSPNRSFMFRWQSTLHPHLQGFIKHPTGSEQYENFPQADRTYIQQLIPNFDRETLFYYRMYSEGILDSQVIS